MRWVIQSRNRGYSYFSDWVTAVVAQSREVAERYASIYNIHNRCGWEYRAIVEATEEMTK